MGSKPGYLLKYFLLYSENLWKYIVNSIKGYQLSDVDVIVANHINELPTSYVHVNRWFKHVTNQEDKPSEIAKLPKNVKSDLLAHFGLLFS